MKLSGFTFIRNTIKYDYPFQEAVESMLPLIDELVINLGESEDGTEDFVQNLLSQWLEKNPRLDVKLLHSRWNDSLTDSGLVLSEQTNIALDACTGDWGLYLQADEALHESEHEYIKRTLNALDQDPLLDGLRFRYLHFYGGYTAVQRPWNWYPSEIRLIRLKRGIRSFGDAQTFRFADGTKLKSQLIDAHIFHYGHARHPETMKHKIHYFHRFWHGDDHKMSVTQAYHINTQQLVWYWGSHPNVYKKRSQDGQSWSPKPVDLLPKVAVVAILARSTDSKALGIELVNILSRKHKMVLLTDRFLEILRWQLKKEVLFIDLEAGRRSYLTAFLFALISRIGFKNRLAYVDDLGRLPRVIAKIIKNICWTSHENPKEGFVVPHKYRPQLIATSITGLHGSLDSK